MAAITAASTNDAQSNPFTNVREFYANEYKEKKLTDNELSAAVVVNIVNCLPRRGGIESSRWATKNNRDEIPPSESIQKISSKNGSQKRVSHKNSSPTNDFGNNGSPKKTSDKNGLPKNIPENKGSSQKVSDKNGLLQNISEKNVAPKNIFEKNGSPNNTSENNGSPKYASYKNGSRNNRFFKKNNHRNDFPKGKMSLMSPPPYPKAEVVVAKAQNSGGTNPLAEEFIPSRKPKSPVGTGDLATSTDVVEATGLNNTRVPSPSVARSPDWGKKAKKNRARRTSSKPVSPICQDSYVPPHKRPTLEEAINPKYVPSARIGNLAKIRTYPQEDKSSRKLTKSLVPDTQAGRSAVVAKRFAPHTYTTPHRRQNSKLYKEVGNATTTTGLPSFTHADNVTGHSRSEKSEAAAKQASSFKSSSPSSGVSAWKNHRAIIEQSDRALNKECEEAATAAIAEYQNHSIRDTWIPAVVDDGCRNLRKAITLTIGGGENPAAFSCGYDTANTQTQDNLKDSNKLSSSSPVDERKELASSSGVLCDWGESTDGEPHDLTDKKAEATAVEISELKTGVNVDSVIIEETAITNSDRGEIKAVERFQVDNGTTTIVTIRNQIQDQGNQISSLGVNTIHEAPASSSIISDRTNKLEVFTAGKSDLTTDEKLQDDSGDHVTQPDAQNSDLAVSKTVPAISSPPGCSVISNGENFRSAKAGVAMNINSEVGMLAISEVTICQVPRGEPNISVAIVNAVAPPPASQGGKIATSWDEFTRGSGQPAIFKNYRFQTQPNLSSSSSNIVANTFEAPPLENLKGGIQVQDCKVATCQSGEKHSNTDTVNGEQCVSTGVAGGSKQSSSLEVNVYPPAVVLNTSNEFKQRNELESPAQVHAALVKEIIDQKRGKDTIPLTRTNLMERTGVAPLETSCWGIDKAVSDDGVEGRDAKTQNCDPKKQQNSDIRNLLVGEQRGMDLWEGDRAEVDLSYMPAYIKSWASNIPTIPKPVDTTCDEFKTGLSALSQLKFEKPIAQPLCYPDVAGSENTGKAHIQTAEIDCKQYMRESIKKQRRKDRAYTSQVAHNSTQFHHTHIDPNVPTTSCHLRPAEERDIPGITAIYNHYISNSFIPEDQKRITEEEMQTVWATARRESLPFIVAIQGPPLDHNNPYKETVLGFARADIYYGIGGGSVGRSRYLGVIEFYTHHQYIRNGIGRSLLDRILCITSTSYLQKGGYDWAIPNAYDNPVYNDFSGGGSPRRWHQLLIHRPIEIRDDPDYEWLKDWLKNKFYFFEVGRLKSIARTKPVGSPARWLDMVTFQLEASTPGEFEAFQ